MENQKTAKYANVALTSGILSILFGFGFGVINLAFFLITIAAAVFALYSNKEGASSVRTKSIVALGVVAVNVVLYYVFGISGIVMPVMESLLK